MPVAFGFRIEAGDRSLVDCPLRPARPDPKRSADLIEATLHASKPKSVWRSLADAATIVEATVPRLDAESERNGHGERALTLSEREVAQT